MRPFSAALWIAKFVASVALLLVVIPAGLFYSGAYAVLVYQEHKETIAAQAHACTNARETMRTIDKQRKELAGLDLPAEYKDATSTPMLGNSGVGGNSARWLWYFSDGSSEPLEDFIATEQKEIATNCK